MPWKALVGFGAYLLLIPFLLFVSAGSVTWLMGWIYAALFVASIVGSRLIVWRTNPDLLAERARFAEVEGVKAWDRTLMLLSALVGPIVTVVVAGLDYRFGWPPSIPLLLQVLGLLLVVAGYVLAVWAMLANKYFSAVYRIQKERGHVVVATGPYAAIRHPGYAGGIVSGLATPFMLDAIGALVPVGLVVLGLLVRTALEDQALCRELPGYEEYAAQVRFRLLPGVW